MLRILEGFILRQVLILQKRARRFCKKADGGSITVLQKDEPKKAKSGVVFLKIGSHDIVEHFCLASVDIAIHLFFALLFKAALSRCRPHKYYFMVTFEILVHKMSEYNGFAASRTVFENNGSMAAVKSAIAFIWNFVRVMSIFYPADSL